MMRALILALLFWAMPACAVNYTDIWWNKSESGWGLTLAHQNNKIFGVWYVYDKFSRPLWVVMPDGAFSNSGRTFTGALYTTTGPSLSTTPFDPGQVAATQVGQAKIDFDADGVSATVAYNIGAVRVSKRVSRQSFGNAPANSPDDQSDLWWDPAESGWGLALTQHGDTVFAVWYTYGSDGKPLWVVMPDGRFSQPGRFAGKLYTTDGGSPVGTPFDPKSVQVHEVGSGTITIANGEGRFTGTVNGFDFSKRLTRQLFGAAKPANQKPVVTLTVVPDVSPPKAPATVKLKATATDPDGRIAKVEFFEACEKLAEDTATPFEKSVSGLAAGKHYFSALATDNLGASRLASAWIEVKSATVDPPKNNPPAVSLSAPVGGTTIFAGTTVALSANASDSDGTVTAVSFYAGANLIGQASAAPWSASWVATAGDNDLTAVATDDKGLAATSAPVSISVVGPPAPLDLATRDAARFLVQATFGPRSVAEILALRDRGYESWLTEQFSTQANLYVAYVNARKAAGEKPDEERAYEAVWQQWLFETGQLRARMSFALSEIFVISNIAPDLDTYAMASYMDMLNRNAFGNYRQLLEDVTLHPAMGYYLNMIGSKKANPAKGTHPNENYAREVMQLFSDRALQAQPRRHAHARRRRQPHSDLRPVRRRGHGGRFHRLELLRQRHEQSGTLRPGQGRLDRSAHPVGDAPRQPGEDVVRRDAAARGPERAPGHEAGARRDLQPSQRRALRRARADPALRHVQPEPGLHRPRGRDIQQQRPGRARRPQGRRCAQCCSTRRRATSPRRPRPAGASSASR